MKTSSRGMHQVSKPASQIYGLNIRTRDIGETINSRSTEESDLETLVRILFDDASYNSWLMHRECLKADVGYYV
jgi:hypothetical protein